MTVDIVALLLVDYVDKELTCCATARYGSEGTVTKGIISTFILLNGIYRVLFNNGRQHWMQRGFIGLFRQISGFDRDRNPGRLPTN